MILYLGNILSPGGGRVGFLETLTPRLGDRFRVQVYSARRNKLARLAEMLIATFRLRREVSVVLIDTFSTQAFWFAVMSAILCKLLGMPYVPVLRGGNLPERLVNSPRVCQWLFSGAAQTIVPSRYLGESLSSIGVRAINIPNFIEIGSYPFRYRSTVEPKLLWVRGFHQIYNPMMALEVVKVLLDKYPKTVLCMVGGDVDGTQTEVKSAIAASNLNDHVQLMGRLNKAEWIELAVNYDIFINTTHIDNLPVSVIEAMALGLPVVSTDVGGIPYLLTHEETALMIRDGDIRAMAECIDRLVTAPSLSARLSKHGRTRAEEFSWEMVGPKWFTLLDSFETHVPAQ